MSSYIYSRSNKVSEAFLLMYVVSTLFIGSDVKNYLGLGLGEEGVIPLIHYISLPFLILSYLLYHLAPQKPSFLLSDEKKLLFFSFLILFFQKFIMEKRAGFSIIINNVFEPIFLLSTIRMIDSKYSRITKRISNCIILFIIIESIISIYEYTTRSLVFGGIAQSTRVVLDTFSDMRSHAMHGHPLQNAFLVSIVITAIITSKMGETKRYILFLLGYVSILCFNTRSSMLLMVIVLLINMVKDFFIGKRRSLKKIIVITLFLLGISLLYMFVTHYGFGSRMAITMNSHDSSANARYVLVDLIKDLNLHDIIFGTTSITLLMKKYSVTTLENSVLNFIISFGIIYTTMFFYYWYKIIKRIQINKYLSYSVFVVSFLLFNANNSILTENPIFPFIVMSLYSFGKLPTYNGLNKNKI